MKKVLFVIWSFSYGGGAERVLGLLINGLHARGNYQIYLQEIVHFDIAWESIPADVMVLPPVIDETATGFTKRVRRGILRRMLARDPERACARARGSKAYDLVVSFNYQLPSFFLKATDAGIAWNHGVIDDLEHAPVERERQRKAYERAKRIVAIAPRTKDSIVRLFPEFEDKLRVIYNGFDFAAIDRKAAEEVPFECGRQSFMFLGRLDENKNPLAVLEMFKAIREKNPQAQLYYLGKGELRPQLEAAIAQNGLQECVHVLGYISNPYPYIKQADCLLAYSNIEGFQTIFVEALALGVPFISSDAGASDLLSGGGRFGQIVGNPEDAAQAYERLLAQRTSAEYTQSMKQFIEQYSLEAQVDAFEALAREIWSSLYE